MVARVRVSGFRELARELGRAGPVYVKRLRAVNKAIAEEVAIEARRRYLVWYTSESGGSLKSIRALGAQTRASVAIGNAANPHLGAQEFGSMKVPQFRPRTPKGKFLYPAIADLSDEQIERYGDELMEVMRAAFPEVA